MKARYLKQWATKYRKLRAKTTQKLTETLEATLSHVFARCRIRGKAKRFKRRGRRPAVSGRAATSESNLLRKAESGLKVACGLSNSAAKGSALSVYDEIQVARTARLKSTLATIGDKYGLSDFAVKHALQRQGEFVLEAQLLMLTRLTSWLRDTKPDLQFAFCGSMVDETGQKMTFTSIPNLRPKVLSAICDGNQDAAPAVSAQALARIAMAQPGVVGKTIRRVQQIQTVSDVMAARFVFSWKEAGPGAKLCAFEFIPQPFQVPSPSARNLWSVLRHQPTMEALVDFKRALLQQARFGADVLHTDDASGNGLFHAADVTDERCRGHRWGIMRQLCLDHKAHHCLLVPVGGVFSIKYVSSLYRCSVFFGMSTYMLRCVFSISGVLREPGRVKVTRDEVPRTDRLYAEQLVDLIVSTASGTSKELKCLRSKLEVLFFHLWNCMFGERFVVGHACRGAQCVCGGTSENLLLLLISYVSSVMFGRCIPRPSTGKWLQLVLCLRQLILGQVASMFQLLAETGLKKVKFGGPSAEGDMDHGVESFALEACWHAVAGKRHGLVMADLCSAAWTAKAILLGIILEPVQAQHFFFIDTSLMSIYTEKNAWPPILDLLNPSTSLVHSSLQYWSSLLASPGEVDRLWLIIKFRGCHDYAQWATTYPEDATILCKATMGIIAASERRILQYLQKEFGIISSFDGRRSAQERRAERIIFCKRNRCCMEPGLHRFVYDHCEAEVEALVLLRVELLMFSWFIRLSVACIERLHKLNRDLLSTDRMGFATFAAKSILSRLQTHFAELTTAAKSWHKVETEEGVVRPAKAMRAGSFERELGCYRRALSPFEVFRKRLQLSEKTEGRQLDFFSDAGKQQARDAWDRASIDVVCDCEDVSNLMKSVSKSKKRAQKLHSPYK